MTTHLLVRVDGDVYATELRGDLAAALAYLIGDVALPDPSNSVHAAIVTATDAGAARFAPVGYWVGREDVDADNVVDVARSMKIDDPDVDGITTLASALVASLARYALAYDAAWGASDARDAWCAP
jgi:hypothetical protein